MSHHYKLSVAAIHMKNARKLVEEMKNVNEYKNLNYNYSQEAYEVFAHNVSCGVLAIFSINAALESIISFLARTYNITERGFHKKLKKLVKIQVVPNSKELKKLINLRHFRNEITHWNENYVEFLGTMSYLPIMFGDSSSCLNDKTYGLISILSKEKMMEYKLCLESVLDDVISIEEQKSSNKVNCFINDLYQIKDGAAVIG